jgi:hypothetical protein
MALIEINLEKPALVEERAASRSASERGRTDSPHRSGSDSFDRSGDGDSSGGGKLKLLGLLAAVVAVGAVVAKLKGRGSDDGDQSRAYDHGPEPEIGGDESGGRMRKVAGLLGLVGAIASTLAIARKGRT